MGMSLTDRDPSLHANNILVPYTFLAILLRNVSIAISPRSFTMRSKKYSTPPSLPSPDLDIDISSVEPDNDEPNNADWIEVPDLK
jgi:hypothetical protein